MDSIVLQHHYFTVVDAPQDSHVSLSLLGPEGITVDGTTLVFGHFPQEVVYEVVGWDAEYQALQVRKVADYRDIIEEPPF